MKAGGNPQKLSVNIIADARKNDEQVMRVSSGSNIVVSPNGKEVAFLYRGVDCSDVSRSKDVQVGTHRGI